MELNFFEKTNKYRPVFFHWLDGFIKKDIGNSKFRTTKFINEVIGPLCSRPELNKEITICNHTIISNKKLLEFTNLKTKEQNRIYLNPFTHEISIYSNSDEIKSNINFYLLKLFNYCIVQLGDEVHAISLLTFIKEKKLFACIVNSGEGIGKNDLINKTFINGVECCLPHQSMIICDDIDDDKKLYSGFKTIR